MTQRAEPPYTFPRGGRPPLQRIRVLIAVALSAMLLAPVARIAAHDHPPESNGHLPGSSRDVELVGRVRLTNVRNGIGDVAALGNHAYLASYSAECFNPDGPGGGVHIVDFSIPQLPREVGFISAGNAYVGEGVHAFSMRTKHFRGDVLLFSTEPCRTDRKVHGGISLWDVTDPTAPKPLARGAGDRNPKPRGRLTAHASHSARAWTVGKKAYAVVVDNDDYLDVDIMDITNPRKPKLIAETGLAKWPRADRGKDAKLGTFPGSFHHDMWIQKVGGHWYVLASYWDTGWVLINVDNPRRPRYVRDYDFPKKDPLTKNPPEGNAHQATWSADGKFILGTTEDFFAKFTGGLITEGRRSTFLDTVEYPWTDRLRKRFGILSGRSVYGGLGCPPVAIPPAASVGGLGPGEIPIVVLQDGVCSISDKLSAAERAGYRAAVLAASHVTSEFGQKPRAYDCTQPLGGTKPRIVTLCISHEDFHRLLRSPANFVDVVGEEPVAGDRGSRLQAFSFYHRGWGDLHLLDGKSLKELDAFAIPEALKEEYAEAFGVLSAHEVKTDPRKKVHLAYASWYGGGLRVMSFSRKGIREVGHYLDSTGNMFWGTFPIRPAADQRPLLLMSDMHYGLFIFRYTGPADPIPVLL